MPSVRNNYTSATWKKFSNRLIFCSLLFGALAGSPAWAANVQTTMDEYFCAEDIKNVGNCTANEVSLSGVIEIQITDVDGNPLSECYDGQIVKIANLQAELDNNTGQRWDITFWVGRYGNDPRTASIGTPDPTACSVTTLPTNTGSLYITDDDLDNCLDFAVPPAPVPVTFGGGNSTFECRDTDGSGLADLVVLTTWQQSPDSSNGFFCGGGDQIPPLDINDPVYMPGSPSKCDITILETVPIVATASLTVTKISQGGTNVFAFNGAGFPTGGVFDGLFQLDTTPLGGTASLTDPSIILTDGVNGDTFTINEVVPAGWNLANATCSNGDDPTTGVTLVAGDNVTCTFTDVADGSVTIIKNTIGGDATFNYTSGTPPIPASFNIMTVGGTGSASTTGLEPGTYSVTETPLANWDLTNLSCVDPNGNSTWDLGTGTVTINLEAGETITCTYENTQRGAFVLNKATTPSSTDVFQFTHDIVGDTVPASPVNVTTGTPQNFLGVVPGSYTVTETDPTPAYDLNNISCTDGVGNVVDTTFDIGTRTATVNVDPGETVSCTFLNVARGNLTVVKDLSADGPASTVFDFLSTALGNFQLSPVDSNTPASTTFANLVEDFYDLAEVDPTGSGWALVSATCTDGTDLLDPNAANPGSVYVDPGEDVTCTFVNSPLGSSTIIKNTIGGDDTFTYTGTAQNGVTNPMDGLSLTTVGGTDFQDFSYQLVPEGNPFTVTEDTVNPPGWVLTNIVCNEDGTQDTTTDIPNATASINVDLAEAVTCTFTNTADATLVVQKSTVPTGLADAFTFTSDGVVNWDTSGATTAALADGQSDSQTGQPGIYSATETVLPGFAITNISCSGETLSTIQIGDGTPAFEDGDDYVDVTLAAGETVTCVFENTALGSIQVVKNTLGGDGSFPFSSPQLGGFQLDTTGNTANTTFDDLLPGDYMIGEIVPQGWDLNDLSCTGESNTTYTYTSPSVTVHLLDGENIVCTWVDAERGSITVAKATDPTGSTQSFDFTGDITATLTDGQLSGTVSVAAGQYSVTETPVQGWDVTDITCTDADSSGAGNIATFNVDSGEHVVCYFTNTIQRGQIIVDKQTAPAESAQLFDFTLTGTGVDQSFQLADTTTPYNSGDLLPTSENGTYNLAEGVLPEGWSLVSATCSDGSDPASIDLAPGEIVTCTFVNAEAGQSTFTKVSVGGDDTFNFTNTGPSGNFSLTTVGGVSPVASLTGLDAGQYVITEEALAGWVLTNIVCTESADQDSVIDIPNRTVTLNVQDGETINCTVTNTKNGSITVAKTTVPSGLSTQFDFTGDVTGTIGDGGFITVSDLVPGTYSSVEAVTAGFDLTSIVCNDGVSTTPSTGDTGTRTVTFNLDPGEDVTCTFTNTVQYGSIIVDKVTVPAGSAQSFDFTLTGTGVSQSFALTHAAAPHNSGDLLPTFENGTYNVAEAAVADWTGESVCSDGSPAGAVDLDPGEVVTCTFTNTLSPSINLTKTATGPVLEQNGTYTVIYTITASNAGGPGVYDLTDTFSPAAGIVLNTAVLTGYASANDTQTGAIIGGALPAAFVSGDTIVTGEALAAGNAETWTITANFTVVPADLTGDATDCVQGAEAPGKGFYNYVDGNIDEDTSDNDACVNLFVPAINLAKAASAAIPVGNNTWEVVYTITATNTGDGPGEYDIIDTMMPGTGITPVIDGSYPAISYAGGEVQSGVVTTPPLANGGTWVTGESLAALSAESWKITARFTVDLPTLTGSPGSDNCILTDNEQGTGYFNYVEGSATDTDLSDNEACVPHVLPGVPVPALNKLSMLLLTLMLLAIGWSFRPAVKRKF